MGSAADIVNLLDRVDDGLMQDEDRMEVELRERPPEQGRKLACNRTPRRENIRDYRNIFDAAASSPAPARHARTHARRLDSPAPKQAKETYLVTKRYLSTSTHQRARATRDRSGRRRPGAGGSPAPTVRLRAYRWRRRRRRHPRRRGGRRSTTRQRRRRSAWQRSGPGLPGSLCTHDAPAPVSLCRLGRSLLVTR